MRLGSTSVWRIGSPPRTAFIRGDDGCLLGRRQRRGGHDLHGNRARELCRTTCETLRGSTAGCTTDRAGASTFKKFSEQRVGLACRRPGRSSRPSVFGENMPDAKTSTSFGCLAMTSSTQRVELADDHVERAGLLGRGEQRLGVGRGDAAAAPMSTGSAKACVLVRWRRPWSVLMSSLGSKLRRLSSGSAAFLGNFASASSIRRAWSAGCSFCCSNLPAKANA